jgi:hypothetical protein
MRKILTIIGVLIVLGVGGCWGYQNFIRRPPSEPEPAPTDRIANWKTYTNAIYAYEVRYPADFHLHLTGYRPLPPYGVRFGNYPTDGVRSDFVYFEVSVTRETKLTPLDQVPELSDLTSKGYTKAELMVDDWRAIKVVKPQAGLSAVVYLIKGNYLYRLALTTATVALGQASLDEFDLFVGSLEFY